MMRFPCCAPCALAAFPGGPDAAYAPALARARTAAGFAQASESAAGRDGARRIRLRGRSAGRGLPRPWISRGVDRSAGAEIRAFLAHRRVGSAVLRASARRFTRVSNRACWQRDKLHAVGVARSPARELL